MSLVLSLIAALALTIPAQRATPAAAILIGDGLESQLTYTGATSGTFNSSFTAAATLIDPNGGTPIAGKTITFTLGTQGCQATTDASGQGSCAITITQNPPGPGTIGVSFAGDAVYNPSSAFSAFTINGAASGNPPSGFVIPAGATASFTNVGFGACNRLSWGYQLNRGTNQVQASFAGGCTSASEPDVTIGPFSTDQTLLVFLRDDQCGYTYYSDGTPVDHVIVSGSNPYTLRFADGGGFCERAQTTTDTFPGYNFQVQLQINPPKEQSQLTYTGATSGDFTDSVAIAADLVVKGTLAPIPNAAVTFTLGNLTCPATTNASGQASCEIGLSQDPPGPGTISVSFAGDANDTPSSASSTFTVNQEQSQLTYTGQTSGTLNGSVTAAATLIDPDGGAPIVGKTITFTLGTQGCQATTDANGRGSCTITITQNPPGPGTIGVSFAGDVDYTPSSASSTFTVNQNQNQSQLTYTGQTSGEFNDHVTLAGDLVVKGTMAAIPNAAVTFTLGTQGCSARTGHRGHASCVIRISQDPSGPGTVNATFAGDANDPPASASSTFTVTKERSRLTYTGARTADGHDAFTAAATLTDPHAPVAGKTITFTLGTQRCSARTHENGRASCTIIPTLAAGNHTLTASFAGDSDYLAAQDSAAFTIRPRRR